MQAPTPAAVPGPGQCFVTTTFNSWQTPHISAMPTRKSRQSKAQAPCFTDEPTIETHG